MTSITSAMPAKVARLVDQRPPAGADAAAKHESSDRDDHRGDRRNRSRPAGRRLDLIAQPGQRQDQHTRSPCRAARSACRAPTAAVRSQPSRSLASASLPGRRCCRRSRQQARRPADAKAVEAAAMQQEERDHGKREEEQSGIEALRRQPRDEQRQQQQRRQARRSG